MPKSPTGFAEGVQGYKFPGIDKPTNDLHVEFDVSGVSVHNKGSYDDWETDKNDDKVINLTSADGVDPNTDMTVEFDFAGQYFIEKWWFTLDGTRVGKTNEGGPPKTD